MAGYNLMARETINNAESGLSVRAKLNDNFIELYAGAGSQSLPNGTVSLPAVRAAADQDTGIFFPAANTVAVATGGSERMRIDASGNVLVATTSASTGNTGNGFVVSSGGDLISRRISGAGRTHVTFVNGGVTVGTIQTSTTATTYNTSSTSGITGVDADTVAIRTNSAERMRIDSAGNVGIGETAPDYKLDVNGTFGFTPGASVTPVDNGDVVFELTNNTTLTIKAKGSDGVVRSGTITLA
jgi:hypothetical protein